MMKSQNLEFLSFNKTYMKLCPDTISKQQFFIEYEHTHKAIINTRKGKYKYLNLSFDVIDGVAALDPESDGYSSGSLDEDLHLSWAHR